MRRWRDCVAEDMEKMGAREEDEKDRSKWKELIRTVDSNNGNKARRKGCRGDSREGGKNKL